jgi:phage portal protein BeeE
LVQDGQRTNEEKADDPIQFTDSELIYLPRNRRAHKAYGFSPVEQIFVTINTGLRRQISQLNEFTDGNMPPGMITAPAGWN